MNRRSLLQTAALGAAALAAPRIGRAQSSRILRFVPYVDLAILDPMINTRGVGGEPRPRHVMG